ncbi:MAG: nucleotidyltransferase domain-containing protein [Thermoplasmata archaeon]
MLNRIFGSKARVKIVRVLASNPGHELTLEEVAENAELALGTAHPAIKDLVMTRIILTRRAGRSTLYKINDNHILYSSIKELFLHEMTAHIKVAEEFAARIDKTGVESLVLFGSVARGEFARVGDVDILIVSEDGSAPPGTDSLALEMLDTYDTIISPMSISVVKLSERLAKFDGFMLRVAEEGRLLYGDAEWLGK